MYGMRVLAFFIVTGFVSCVNSEEKPHDCNEIFLRDNKTPNDLYRVYPDDETPVQVFCDMTTSADGPWLVFQRRKDGSVDFFRDWKNYTYGFGDRIGEFWIGNENLFLLTNSASDRRYKLRIDLEDCAGNRRFADYSSFSVSSIYDLYRLSVSGYSGNAGDSFQRNHDGKQFSTKDADHDSNFQRNCANEFCGAWWYKDCHESNLNGMYLRGGVTTQYAQGIIWYDWTGFGYSLKTTEMKISRIN